MCSWQSACLKDSCVILTQLLFKAQHGLIFLSLTHFFLPLLLAQSACLLLLYCCSEPHRPDWLWSGGQIHCCGFQTLLLQSTVFFQDQTRIQGHTLSFNTSPLASFSFLFFFFNRILKWPWALGLCFMNTNCYNIQSVLT